MRLSVQEGKKYAQEFLNVHKSKSRKSANVTRVTDDTQKDTSLTSLLIAFTKVKGMKYERVFTILLIPQFMPS